MSPDTTNRATCPVCAHQIRVTRAGVLAPHLTPPTMIDAARQCPGSGRPPETLEVWPEGDDTP